MGQRCCVTKCISALMYHKQEVNDIGYMNNLITKVWKSPSGSSLLLKFLIYTISTFTIKFLLEVDVVILPVEMIHPHWRALYFENLSQILTCLLITWEKMRIEKCPLPNQSIIWWVRFNCLPLSQQAHRLSLASQQAALSAFFRKVAFFGFSSPPSSPMTL